MWEDIKAILRIMRESVGVLANSLLGMLAAIFNPVIGVTLFLYQTVQVVSRGLTGTDVDFGKLKTLHDNLKAVVLAGTFGSFPAAIQPYILWCNYWFPPSELLIIVGLLSVMYALSCVVRIVKAFIPTIA